MSGDRGTLPAGLTLNGTTGAITGTAPPPAACSAALPVTGVDTTTLTALGLLLITAGVTLVNPVGRPSGPAGGRRP
ncbi:putative Ig domain-containing protein [Dactylosporangium sp. NPDC000521]|uniref:putative Ig domain-containing protein n=1 Tax=Dactylosporangium sp. NPDC000521 TaxID=3363975 RepID=UPI0036BCB49C